MNQLSCVYVFCFFKQKTAYEMRISDWSSDVCSSDLASELLGISQIGNDPKHRVSLRSSMDIGPRINVDADLRYVSRLPDPHVPGYVELGARIGWRFIDEAELSIRSEEHPSELQSLMRISYAVFCLKKQKNKK